MVSTVVRTVGTTNGSDSGSQYTGITTNLTLTEGRQLSSLQFYAVEAGTYALVIKGSAVATATADAPGLCTLTPATPVDLTSGTVGVVSTSGNKRVHYANTSSIAVESGMQVAGWLEYTPSTSFSAPWVWGFESPLLAPQNGLVLTTPYRRVIWSIAVQLGRRFGQLWPNGYGPTEPPQT